MKKKIKDFTSIAIPNSVTSIGAHAFQNCYNLKSVRIPNGVKSIENGTFCGCESLEKIIIPNSVTYIGRSAFYDCSSLKSIYINKEKDSLSLSLAGILNTTKVYWSGEFEEVKE